MFHALYWIATELSLMKKGIDGMDCFHMPGI